MKKWSVTISFAIQAEHRREAWDIAQQLCDKKLRGLANVLSVDIIDYVDTRVIIAMNEPVKAR